MDNETADINRNLAVLKHALWGAWVALLFADLLGPSAILFPADIVMTASEIRMEIGDVQTETLRQIEQEFATIRSRLDEFVVGLPSRGATQ